MMKELDIKPISLWENILLFGIPGLFLYLGLYYGIPNTILWFIILTGVLGIG